jgi:hypothetical protein
LQLVKKFPEFLWNPKFLYHTHKCPPLVPILSRLYPVPTTHSKFLKINLTIILSSTSGSPHWPLSLWFSHQHPVHTSLLSHTRHMPLPPHYSRFTTRTILGKEYRSFNSSLWYTVNKISYVLIYLIFMHSTNLWMLVSDIISRQMIEGLVQNKLKGTVDPRVTTGLTYEQLGLRPKF